MSISKPNDDSEINVGIYCILINNKDKCTCMNNQRHKVTCNLKDVKSC